MDERLHADPAALQVSVPCAVAREEFRGRVGYGSAREGMTAAGRGRDDAATTTRRAREGWWKRGKREGGRLTRAVDTGARLEGTR